MKFKVYSTTKDMKVEEAIDASLKYFTKIKVEYTPITYIKPVERKSSLYETVLSWALNILKSTKSLKTEYIYSLGNDGCDGIILFVDKDKAREDSNLYGQHSVKDGISCIEVYVSDKYYKTVNGKEGYSSNKIGAIRTQASHTLIHEVMHAYSRLTRDKIDILHAFILENQFDGYQDYLKANTTKVNERSEKMYHTALEALGIDVTPKDEYPDAVSCAITVNKLAEKAFGKPIEKAHEASTYWLYKALMESKEWERVDLPDKGCVIISPTGYAGPGGILPNGHTGIVGVDGNIMSNDSATGLFTQNYTIESWRKRYVDQGKFPMAFFRPI